MQRRGRFITFEGGEGSGKSTQIKLLSAALTERAVDHLVTREPGGTPLAERIRPLLVCSVNSPLEGESQKTSVAKSDAVGGKKKSGIRNQESEYTPPPNLPPQGGEGLHREDWTPLAETLLFLAARAQHWEQKIQPTLAGGQWVLCDRFMDSTLVYQGIGKGLGLEKMRALHAQILPDVTPDLTFWLDIAPEEGLRRAHARADDETRFESLDIGFHQRLREGFAQLAAEEPGRFVTIDAAQGVETVAAEIWQIVVRQIVIP